jgi:DNA-binding XRE family transcriptional regulator
VRKVQLHGKKVKELRDGRDRRATQREFAHEIRISKRKLRAIENENAWVQVEIAERLASALNTTVGLLSLGRNDGPAAPPLSAQSSGEPIEAARNEQLQPAGPTEDLVAFGPDIICTGELLSVDVSAWAIQVRQFVIGDFNGLVDFIDRFASSPGGDRYVLVNTLGDGRVLAEAPAVSRSGDGYLVRCPVAPNFPRIEAGQVGSQWALSPETNDVFIEKGQIARVSGLDALPQHVRTCLSLQRGESMFHRDYGVRLAEYFNAFRESPRLGQFLKLELIRQAAIPYHDELQNKQYTPLSCVEGVWGIEILAEAPENGWLPVRVDFDVCGVGRWQQELSICMPSVAKLKEIQSRKESFAALGLGGGVAAGGRTARRR